MKLVRQSATILLLLLVMRPFLTMAQGKNNANGVSPKGYMAVNVAHGKMVLLNEPLDKALNLMYQRYGIIFLYETGFLKGKHVKYKKALPDDPNEAAKDIFTGYNVQIIRLNDHSYGVLDRNDKNKKILQKKFRQLEFAVNGTVTDSKTGDALPGVDVIVKGTSNGTATDKNGKYSLSVANSTDTLIFSYIGYKTQVLPIDRRHLINVSLTSSTIQGQEMVVTALGVKQQKSTLSYTSQSVKAEPLTEARSLNVVNSLEGKVAGLSISQTGGGVGAASRVVLRGNRSISGDSQPLYVVDGVPVLGYPQYLSPDDIASINVLKGANAAALYGSDAQNGVIIIDTKKGVPGQVHVSLNNTFMVKNADLGIPFQNVYGQGTGGVYQSGSIYSWGPKMTGQTVQSWNENPADANQTYAMNSQPNNVQDFFRTGYNVSNNIQASVGLKNMQVFFSTTATEAAGIVQHNNLGRNDVLLRVTGNLSKKIALDAKLDYTRQNVNNPLRQSDSNFNPMQQIYMIPRNIRTQDAKQYEFPDLQGVLQQNFWSPGAFSTAENPYWVINRNISNDKTGEVSGMASLTYNFSSALNLLVRASYDEINENYTQKDYNGTLVRALYGRYTVTKNFNYEFNSDFLLSYTKSFSDWNVDAHVGGNIKRQLLSQSLNSNTGDALLVPNFFSLSNTNLPVTNYNPGDPLEIQSLYASGKIGWKDAVYLNLTGRNDWSSTLPASSRSYFYPSAGLSVILTNLIPNFPKLFNFAKIRASWAKVGSSPDPFMLQRTARFSSGGNNGFLSLNNVLPDKQLKPEETNSIEGGFNLGALDGRIGLNFTYFKTNTINQLFTIALPVASGASSYFTNGGNIQNKGIEVVFNATPVQTSNFRWAFDVNFSHMKNTVVSISDQRPKVVISGPSSHYFSDYVIQQGLPFGDMFTVGFQRDSQGRVIVGSNGIPLISNQRDYNMGSYTPDWTGSISSTISYKNLSLSFVISHRQGGVVGSFTDANLAFVGALKETLQGRNGGLVFGKNFFSKYTAVTQNGQPNNIQVNAEAFWKAVANPSVPVGELFTEDATNTQLKEVDLGYNLPHSFSNKLHVANIKVSLVGRNLAFLYRATPGLNPDILTGTSTSSEGFSSFPTPTTRSYGVNLKINFE